jgi:hypothetical protein
MSAATWNNKTVIFGGQDVIQGKVFNHLYKFDNIKIELEKVENLKKHGFKPSKRNSHSFAQVGSKGYIYGGANDEGPLNDVLLLDLEELEFRSIKLIN